MSKDKKEYEEHDVLEPREQVYLKPGMWIGNLNLVSSVEPILLDGLLQHKAIEFVPAIVKLVEEIYSNSSDEHIRTSTDPKKRGWILDSVNITITEDGWITVEDNGGITTKIHSTGKKTPQVIFGSLFSSSNYKEGDDKTVVGTNGVGSSLCNIFSHEFNVITADGNHKLHLKWTENMKNVEEVFYEKVKKTEHYTKIKFRLDLERFGIEELSYGTIKLIESKIIAMAAYNTKLKVTFNEEIYSFDTLKDYVKLFGYEESEMLYEKNDDWEHVTVARKDTSQDGYHVGLINGALCSDGSMRKHHEAWTVEAVREYLKSKDFKKLNEGEIIEPTHQAVLTRLNSFVKATVINPEYDSQSKDSLTSDAFLYKNGKKSWRKFSIKPMFNDSTDIIQELKEWYIQKKNSEEAGAVRKISRDLKKKSAKSLRKLIDITGKTKAQRQGSTLFLFEGDSASKSFRTTRNPKTQGALSLRGKCKNSFNMSTLKLITNEEFQNIIVAFGLNPQKPDDLSGLRYDSLSITTDQDYDGFSICGQLLTFFCVHFPEAVKQGRISRTITPLWVSTKGKETKYFYSNEEFEKFKGTGWKSKYMKGLGSLTKSVYADILKNPKIENFVFDEEAIKKIRDWMSGNSDKRKEYLSTIA